MRLENLMFRGWVAARSRTNEEFPEPETSELRDVMVFAARRIMAHSFSMFESELAEQIAHDVMLRLDQFQGRSAFSTWLYRVIRNAILMELREPIHYQEVQLEVIPEPGYVVDGTADFSGLLDRITERERLLFSLIARGYSAREIAEMLSLNQETVRKRWTRLRQKLCLLQNS